MIMKNKYALFIVAGLIISLIACKKENNSSIIGKWQQNKVRIYMIGTNGAILNDTTYSGQSFTNMDYAQFNSDGTCVISKSHYYYPADDGFPKAPLVDTSTETAQYKATGSVYVLTTNTVVNVGNGVITDTARLIGPNSLIVHVTYSVFLFNPTPTVYDSYYTR
jgi:hypothetical protein